MMKSVFSLFIFSFFVFSGINFSYVQVNSNLMQKTTAISYIASDSSYPDIMIDYPDNFTTADKPYIEIRGKVSDENSGIMSLTINGKPQSLASDQSFVKKGIPLIDGLNRFEIKATNHASLSSIQILKIYGKGIGDKANLIVVLNIGNSVAFINGDESQVDPPPYIKNGSTLVPLRFIAEAFGANVHWQPEIGKGTISITLNDTIIILEIGNKIVTVNGSKISLLVPPEITGGRTFVPLRFIAEGFGANVDWEAKTQTIVIVLSK